MATFLKAKLKKSDDQTNIDKYRVAATLTEYHIEDSASNINFKFKWKQIQNKT